MCRWSEESVATEVRADIDLGARVSIRKAAVDRQAAQVGAAVRVGLEFAGDNLDRSIYVKLALLDAQGNVWQESAAQLGPFHQLHDTLLPSVWRGQCGFLLLPGLPPGSYTLAAQVEGEGIRGEQTR